MQATNSRRKGFERLVPAETLKDSINIDEAFGVGHGELENPFCQDVQIAPSRPFKASLPALTHSLVGHRRPHVFPQLRS